MFDLARRGVIHIEQDPHKKKWYDSGPKFTIHLQRDAWRGRQHELRPYESSLIRFLFDEVAQGRDALGSRELKKARGKMQKWFRGWKKLVKMSAGDRPYYDPASTRAAIMVAGIVPMVTVGPAGILGVIAGVVGLMGSLATLRLTAEAKLQRKRL